MKTLIFFTAFAFCFMTYVIIAIDASTMADIGDAMIEVMGG